MTPPLTLPEAVERVRSWRRQATEREYVVQDDAAYFNARPHIDKTIAERILMERYMVRLLVGVALAEGYLVRVHDGEMWAGLGTDSIRDAMEQVMACDEESIAIYKRVDDRWQRCGRVWQVYGNSGWEVHADHNATPEIDAVMEVVEQHGEMLCDAWHNIESAGEQS